MAALIASSWSCQSSDSKGPSSNGSCVAKDATFEDGKYCYEKVQYDSSFKMICENPSLGGQWSAAACDRTIYPKKCISTSMESVNNGPQTEVTYHNYFSEASGMACSDFEMPAD